MANSAYQTRERIAKKLQQVCRLDLIEGWELGDAVLEWLNRRIFHYVLGGLAGHELMFFFIF